MALALVATACHPAFQVKKFTTNQDLYSAGLREFQRGKWQNAITAFDKLTLELPARDTLLSRSYWYLASAHERQGEHLLAAQSFTRLVEAFPDDSLADNAALEAARSYKELWRKPELDATYGQTALSTYGTLFSLYPNSPLLPQAQKELAQLHDWFAQKNYEAGMFYFRQNAFDSAILYFKDVLERWPETPTARDAALRMVEAYKKIRYREDASDMCTMLRQKYPGDREVTEVCRGVPDAAVPDTTPAPPPPPIPNL